MNVVTAGTLARVFRGSTEGAYRQLLQRQQETERERRERKQDIEDEAAEFMDFALAAITSADANDFRIELDRYDTATVAALQENELALIAVQARMGSLLAKAYVLPDGRRIFKTEDGTRVFDEFGAELGHDEIDPQMIDDARPAWEIYKPELEAKNRLIEERRELLDYQAKLDDARERLDRGDLTRKEFDQLREELKTEMPEAVRAQMPDVEPEASAHAEPSAAAEDLAITADMVPASSASKIPTLG